MPILGNHTLDLKAPIHILSLNDQPIFKPSVIDMRSKLDHYGSSRLSIPLKHTIFGLESKLWQPFDKIGFVSRSWLDGIGELETHTSNLVDLWCFYDDRVVDGWFFHGYFTLNSVFFSLGADQYKIIFFPFDRFHGTIPNLQMINLPSW